MIKESITCLSCADSIGAVPEDWHYTKVKNVFDRKKEKSDEKDPIVLSLARTGVRVRDISNNEGQLASSYDGYNPVEPGDLLLNPMDLYSGANCSISDVSGVISPAYFNLRAREGYDAKFYDYFFKTQYWAMALFAKGRGVSFDNRWTLSYEALKDIILPAPGYEEQKKIAYYLDEKTTSIDRMIVQANKSIADYRAWKSSIIYEAATKGLSGKTVFRDSGIEWIKKVPDQWRITRLHNICSFLTGSTPSTKNPEWFDGEIQWFTPGDFNHLYDLYESSRTLSAKAREDKAAKFVPRNTVLIIGIGGTAGKIGYTKVECSFNQQITAILPKSEIIDKRYLMYAMIPAALYTRETRMHTTLPIINNQTLGSVSITLPSKKEQLEIAEYLDETCPKIEAVIIEKKNLIAELEEYKKSIIFEAVTGKRRVV